MESAVAAIKPETEMWRDLRVPSQFKAVAAGVVDQRGTARLQWAGKPLHAALWHTEYLQAVKPHAGKRLRIGPCVAE